MNSINKWTAAALVLAAVIMLSVIGSRLPGQLDMTATGDYTLSDASKRMVAAIEEPVQLEFYFSRSLEGLPIQLKNYSTRVESLLQQYARANRGAVDLRIIDPRPDTDEEQAAIRSGLQAQPLPSGENLFFGLVAHAAENTAAIAFFNPNRESFLEYDISQLIHQVGRIQQPVIAVLSSLELDPQQPPNPMQRNAPSGPAFLTELRRSADVRIIEDPEQLDASIDVLLVLHLQQPDEAMLYAIDQFVLSGRPALLAVDPSSYNQRSSQANPMMGMQGMPNVSSDLQPLFSAWGVRFDPATVVGDQQLAAPVSTQAGGPPTRYPVWLNFTSIESTSPLLATLNNLLLVEAGHFNMADEAVEGIVFEPLLQTTATSGDVAAASLAFSAPEQIARNLAVDDVPRTLAATLTGPLSSAFPDGPPADESSDDDSADAADPAPASFPADHLAQAEKATVILLGDSDFLADDFSVRIMNLFGTRAMTPINDNLSLLFNIVDSLTGNPELIALRGRGTAQRPFTKVSELELQAQAAYQQQLETLEQRLSEVRSRLAELQQRAPQAGQLIADDATRSAIEEFRLEEAEVRSEQRQIRKRLREDIEALNLRLALINLLCAPLLIAGGGIWYLSRRTRNRRPAPQPLAATSE
jgi:ABC-type uncharacterized transport system involved in gliding motility auxiliary subunit